MIKNRFLTILIFSILSFSICADELQIAFEDLKPNHFFNLKKEVVGGDADVLKIIFKKMKIKFKFVEVPWKRTLFSIENGDMVDVGIGAKHTDARAKFAFYSEPYKSIQHHLYVLKNGSKSKSLLNLLERKKTIGLVIGWGYPKEISDLVELKKYKNQIFRIAKFEQLPEMLSKKRVDSIIAEPAALISLPKGKIYESKCIVVEKFSEKLHFLFSKKRVKESVVKRFNNELKRIKASGDLTKIYKKYE
ncbi:MAG: hypothetical protein COA79_07330 [Planctomycetota bacterium]|nr:MAG: hypothetical protein COA79_07330 [Planctomycetota bacterium]